MRALRPHSVASIGNVIVASIDIISPLRNRRSVVTIASPPCTATSIAVATSGSGLAPCVDVSRNRASGSVAAPCMLLSPG